MSKSIWRPPQWNQPSAIMVTVPQQSGAAQYSQSGAPMVVPSGNFVFDAVLEIEHEQRIERTKHPVQTGASISDHAYVIPATVVFNIGMSDAMDAYADGMWAGNASKSVAAYQTLLTIQSSRVPLTVTTRLRTYTNMLIDAISPVETNKTILGLRARVAFGQILAATTSIVPVSARSAVTGTTSLGTVTSQPVPASVQNQFNAQRFLTAPPLNVQGAGDWSSTNVNNLSQPQ